MSLLQYAATLSNDTTVRFSVLLHQLSQQDIHFICNRFRVPREFSELAALTSKYYVTYQSLNTKDPKAILDLLKSVDALRRPERFDLWITTCNAILENINHRMILFEALEIIKNVDIQSLIEKNYQGKAMAEALYQLQLNALRQSIGQHRNK